MNTHRNAGPLTLVFTIFCLFITCSPLAAFDVILRGGTIYDGSGELPFTGDVALNGDKIAAAYDGMYISHMRDEGANMLEAVDELLTIAREANIRAEIYHLKSSGQGAGLETGNMI